MKNLEDKIRESLPRLKGIGVGLRFIDSLGFNAEIVHIDNGTIFYFSESDLEVFSDSFNFFDGIYNKIIGHPIKLNDVLEYIKLKVSKVSHHKIIGNVCLNWDLSSVFLADQSDEIKEFLNNL